MPYSKAAQMLMRMRGVAVSEATVRRQTQTHGAAYVDTQTAEVTRIEKELPDPPAGPEKQLLSVDGAMVPLVGGVWAEVKTLALGVIEEPVMEGGEPHVHAREMSYFSRLMDSDTFAQLALVETHRRGVEKAGKVIAVTDGAEWEQGFIDYHRPDAQRVLDFPHAGAYLARIGAAIWGPETPTTMQWIAAQNKRLKHEGPADMLVELRTLVAEHPETPDLSGWVAYLEKREAHMQYPVYQAQGWPIGSGAVESGNKLVVEARLKGSGMHWAREHVDPMLGLRNAVCNDRWDEGWSQISQQRRRQVQQTRQRRRDQRRMALKVLPLVASQATVNMSPQPGAIPLVAAANATPTSLEPPAETRSGKPWRPAADHPWRQYPSCLPSRRHRGRDARK
ncbi:MAG: ISKra4 family transposase [Chloroflexi bacterium]|nr:ISKra4 family transposase [Chloroflexota bacterium]